MVKFDIKICLQNIGKKYDLTEWSCQASLYSFQSLNVLEMHISILYAKLIVFRTKWN